MSHDLSESKRRLHKSRHDLELSEIQHVILKTFRDKRQIATKSTIAKRFFQREAACVQGSDNSLYCTNRTSLENLFYAKRYSIYTCELQKLLERSGRSQKAMEGNRTSWNLMEISRKRKNVPQVSQVSNGEGSPEQDIKKEREDQVREGSP